MTTVEAIRKLTAAGMPEQQASATMEILEEWHTSNLVTKDFLAAQLAELKHDIKTDLTRWFLTVMSAQTVVILGAVYWMIDHIKR